MLGAPLHLSLWFRLLMQPDYTGPGRSAAQHSAAHAEQHEVKRRSSDTQKAFIFILMRKSKTVMIGVAGVRGVEGLSIDPLVRSGRRRH